MKTKTFKHEMTYTKDRGIFMDMIVQTMNAFTCNKDYLVDVYSQMEDSMAKDNLTHEMVPFEAAAVALIDHKGEHNFKYAKALYNYIYWEYDYITHNNKNHPFLYDCLKHAMNYVECSGLSSFQKKYGKSK